LFLLVFKPCPKKQGKAFKRFRALMEQWLKLDEEPRRRQRELKEWLEEGLAKMRIEESKDRYN